jgi:hypothetical protein
MRSIDDGTIGALLRDGEFPESVRRAAERVVVVMTQGWCPQWHDMRSWLAEFEDRAAIFFLVYDEHPDFGRIMGFKESVFKNFEVPYVRYYRDGRLITACNWLPRRTFAAMLERSEPFRVG